MFYQSKLNFKRIILRNPNFFFFDILIPILFYLLFTKIMPATLTFKRDYLVSMMIYANLLGSVLTVANTLVIDHVSGYAKLLQVLPYKQWQYYASIGSVFWLLNVFCVGALVLTGWVFNGIVFSMKLWLILEGLIPLLATPLMLIGFLLATSRDLNTVNILGNIVFLLAIISGLWFPFQTLPPLVQAIGRYTPVYYVVELARGLIQGQMFNWGYLFGLILWSIILVSLIYAVEKLIRRTN